MQKIAFLLVLTMLLACLSGCAGQKTVSDSFFIMNSVITVTLYTNDKPYAEAVLEECRRILDELEGLWSCTREGSDIARINAGGVGSYEVDERTMSLLQKARDLSVQTESAFDITLAPLSEFWRRCEKENRLPTEEERMQLLAHTGMQTWALVDGVVEKRDGLMQLDLGGIGKGAAADALIAYLKTCTLSGGMVSFGSSVAVFGEKPDQSLYRIGLRSPLDDRAQVGVLQLTGGQALSVSGDYERYVTIEGKRYHHILRPSDGMPSASGLSSVAVICADGATADALSTALLVMGKERALQFCDAKRGLLEAVLIGTDGELNLTIGAGTLFSSAT